MSDQPDQPFTTAAFDPTASVVVPIEDLRRVLGSPDAHYSDDGDGWAPEEKHLGPRCAHCGEQWPCAAQRLRWLTEGWR